MANATQGGGVLPRPRIPKVMGLLNIVIATALMLFSLYIGMYAAIMPMSNRALVEMRTKAAADIEARNQVDLKAVDEAEKTATTAAEKKALQHQRKTIEARPKVALPIGMDFEKMGLVGTRYALFSWVDVTTGLGLDVLMLVAGVGLVGRRKWAPGLGLTAAAAKIVRLVLVYGYVALAIVPPIAQGTGRMAFETVMQQQQAAGRGGAPAGLDAAFFTRIYYIMFTAMAVAMMLFGSVYPAISLWFLSRPGARAACDDSLRDDLEETETRALGVLHVAFASCLILFGLCLGAYITALPLIGRIVNQVQKKGEADYAARQKADLKAIAEDEAKATTESEKEALAEQREAIESRPKPQVMASVDFGKMGWDDPKVRAYYSVELLSGLLLNAAMIATGVGLLRRKRWAITLGIGLALAKIVRLMLVYGYFSVALAPTIAEKSAAMVGRMMVPQQTTAGQAAPPEIDSRPLAQTYVSIYAAIPIVMIVLGSIYPAISLWLLARARARSAQAEKAPPALGMDEIL